MRIDLLGPLDVRAGEPGAERSVDLSGARLRGLLIRLAIDVPRPVSQATLIEALWGEEPPLDPANALQSLVSRLRRGLGDADLVVQMPGGYRLVVERDDVDMHRFADAARRGRDALRSGDAESAAFVLREALDSWHGPTPEGWGDLDAGLCGCDGHHRHIRDDPRRSNARRGQQASMDDDAAVARHTHPPVAVGPRTGMAADEQQAQ